jgi:hypothetical protein
MLPYFHFAVVVERLEDAIPRFEREFGVTFTAIRQTRSALERPERVDYVLQVAYTRGEPPYIELIEGQGDLVFALEPGERMHHVGMWEDDFERKLAAGKADGSWEASVFAHGSETETAWFSKPSALHGVRIEHLPARRRPDFERWVKGDQA